MLRPPSCSQIAVVLWPPATGFLSWARGLCLEKALCCGLSSSELKENEPPSRPVRALFLLYCQMPFYRKGVSSWLLRHCPGGRNGPSCAMSGTSLAGEVRSGRHGRRGLVQGLSPELHHLRGSSRGDPGWLETNASPRTCPLVSSAVTAAAGDSKGDGSPGRCPDPAAHSQLLTQAGLGPLWVAAIASPLPRWVPTPCQLRFLGL